VITGLHDWDFQFFRPNFGAPISNGEEILEMDWVSVASVDRTVMLTLLITPSTLHFCLLVSVLTHQSVPLLAANQELMGVGILIIAEGSSAINLTIFVIAVSEDQFVSGCDHVPHVPPEYAAIR